VTKSESPDFLGTDSLLGPVGVELTDARPQISDDDVDFLQNWLGQEVEYDAFDAAAHVCGAVSRKERKRTRAYWQRSESTILVVRTFADITPLRRHLRKLSRDDALPEHGFAEIWVQDSELTFTKDGYAMSAAILCLHPYWLKWHVYTHHRQMGYITSRDYSG
jgi:hypothetical protein